MPAGSTATRSGSREGSICTDIVNRIQLAGWTGQGSRLETIGDVHQVDILKGLFRVPEVAEAIQISGLCLLLRAGQYGPYHLQGRIRHPAGFSELLEMLKGRLGFIEKNLADISQ